MASVGRDFIRWVSGDDFEAFVRDAWGGRVLLVIGVAEIADIVVSRACVEVGFALMGGGEEFTDGANGSVVKVGGAGPDSVKWAGNVTSFSETPGGFLRFVVGFVFVVSGSFGDGVEFDFSDVGLDAFEYFVFDGFF